MITLLFIPALLALIGSVASPNYQRPTTTPAPAQYKAEALGSWKQGRPLDNVPKGRWWKIFSDTNLNSLGARALSSNQELKAAMARVDQARAVARVSRSQLLVAFGDVENSLSVIRHLADQAEAQSRAVISSRHAASLAEDRYHSGIVAYIEVVDANRDELAAERANAQLAGERLIATVQLIKAPGGGWNVAVLSPSLALRTNH